MLSKLFSFPNTVAISVYYRMVFIIVSPRVSYKGTDVTPIKLQAKSVSIHSALFTEQIPATFKVTPVSKSVTSEKSLF